MARRGSAGGGYRPSNVYPTSSNYGSSRTSNSGSYTPSLFPSLWDCYPKQSSGYVSDYSKSGYNSDYNKNGGYTSDYTNRKDWSKPGYTSDVDYSKSYGSSRSSGYGADSYYKPSTYTSYRRPSYGSSTYRTEPSSYGYSERNYRSYSRSSSREEQPRDCSRSTSRDAPKIEEEQPVQEAPRLEDPSMIRSDQECRAPADFTSSEYESESESTSSFNSNETDDFLICRSTSPGQENNINNDIAISPTRTYKIKRKKRIKNVSHTDASCQTDSHQNGDCHIPSPESGCDNSTSIINGTKNEPTACSSPNKNGSPTFGNKLNIEESNLSRDTSPIIDTRETSRNKNGSPTFGNKLNIEESNLSRDTSPNDTRETSRNKNRENVNKDFRKSVLNMNLEGEPVERYSKRKDCDKLPERKSIKQKLPSYSSSSSSSSSSSDTSSEYENVRIPRSCSKSGLLRNGSRNRMDLRKSCSKHRIELKRSSSKGALAVINAKLKLDLPRSGSRIKLETSKSDSKIKSNLRRSRSLGKADISRSSSKPKITLSRSSSKGSLAEKNNEMKFKLVKAKSSSFSRLPIRISQRSDSDRTDGNSQKSRSSLLRVRKSSNSSSACSEDKGNNEIPKLSNSSDGSLNLPPRPDRKSESCHSSGSGKRTIRRTLSRTKILEGPGNSSKSSSSEQLATNIRKSSNALSKSPSPPSVVTLRPPLPKPQRSPERMDVEQFFQRQISETSQSSSMPNETDTEESEENMNQIQSGRNVIESSASEEFDGTNVDAKFNLELDCSKIKKSPTVVHVGPGFRGSSATSVEESGDDASSSEKKSEKLGDSSPRDYKYERRCTLAPLIYRRNSSVSESDMSEVSNRRDSVMSEDKSVFERRDSVQSSLSEASYQTGISNEESANSVSDTKYNISTNKTSQEQYKRNLTPSKESRGANEIRKTSNMRNSTARRSSLSSLDSNASRKLEKLSKSGSSEISISSGMNNRSNRKDSLESRSLINLKAKSESLSNCSNISESSSNRLKLFGSIKPLQKSSSIKSTSLSEIAERSLQRRTSSSSNVSNVSRLRKGSCPNISQSGSRKLSQPSTGTNSSKVSPAGSQKNLYQPIRNNSRRSSLQSVTTTSTSGTSETNGYSNKVNSKLKRDTNNRRKNSSTLSLNSVKMDDQNEKKSELSSAENNRKESIKSETTEASEAERRQVEDSKQSDAHNRKDSAKSVTTENSESSSDSKELKDLDQTSETPKNTFDRRESVKSTATEASESPVDNRQPKDSEQMIVKPKDASDRRESVKSTATEVSDSSSESRQSKDSNQVALKPRIVFNRRESLKSTSTETGEGLSENRQPNEPRESNVRIKDTIDRKESIKSTTSETSEGSSENRQPNESRESNVRLKDTIDRKESIKSTTSETSEGSSENKLSKDSKLIIVKPKDIDRKESIKTTTSETSESSSENKQSKDSKQMVVKPKDIDRKESIKSTTSGTSEDSSEKRQPKAIAKPRYINERKEAIKAITSEPSSGSSENKQSNVSDQAKMKDIGDKRESITSTTTESSEISSVSNPPKDSKLVILKPKDTIDRKISIKSSTFETNKTPSDIVQQKDVHKTTKVPERKLSTSSESSESSSESRKPEISKQTLPKLANSPVKKLFDIKPKISESFEVSKIAKPMPAIKNNEISSTVKKTWDTAPVSKSNETNKSQNFQNALKSSEVPSKLSENNKIFLKKNVSRTLTPSPKKEISRKKSTTSSSSETSESSSGVKVENKFNGQNVKSSEIRNENQSATKTNFFTSISPKNKETQNEFQNNTSNEIYKKSKFLLKDRSTESPKIENDLPVKDQEKPKAERKFELPKECRMDHRSSNLIGKLKDIDSLLKDSSEDEAGTFEEFESKFQDRMTREEQEAARKRLSLFISKVQDIDDMLGAVSPMSPANDLEEVAASAVKVHESQARRPELRAYTEEIDTSAVRIRESKPMSSELLAHEIDSEAIRIKGPKVMQGHISKAPKQQLVDCTLQTYRCADAEFGRYFETEAELGDTKWRQDLVSRTPATIKVRVILERLKVCNGKELRRVLFGLKPLFQNDPELVRTFVQAEGLEKMVGVGFRTDPATSNYILRALGQLMLHGDGLRAAVRHQSTLRWLYGQLSSRQMAPPVLRLLAIVLDAQPTEAGTALSAAIVAHDQDRGDTPWSRVMALLTSSGDNDMELLALTMTLVNKVLEAVPDQAAYYDIVDCLEEQSMANVSQRFLAHPRSSTELIHQFQLYEAVLQAEDGSDCKKFSPIPFNIKLKTSPGSTGTQRRRSWRAAKPAASPWNKKETARPTTLATPAQQQNVGITPALRRHREREAQNRLTSPKKEEIPAMPRPEPARPVPTPHPSSPSLVEKHRSRFEIKTTEETPTSKSPQIPEIPAPTPASTEKKRLIIRKPKNFEFENKTQIVLPSEKKDVSPKQEIKISIPEIKPQQIQAKEEISNDQNAEPEKTFKEKQKMFQEEASKAQQLERVVPAPTPLNRQKSYTILPASPQPSPKPIEVPKSPTIAKVPDKKTFLGSRMFGRSIEDEKPKYPPSPTQETPPSSFQKREPAPSVRPPMVKREPSGVFAKSPSQSRMGDCAGLVSRAKEGLSRSRSNLLMKQPSSSSLAEFKQDLQWEGQRASRPLLINDLDFRDLDDDDDVDIFKPDILGGGGSNPPPPPPPPSCNGPPPPPPPHNVPPPPPMFMAQRAVPAPPMPPAWVAARRTLASPGRPSPPPPLAKNKKTVKLFWKEVQEDSNILSKTGRKRTIWDELKPIEVDISSLEQLFESRAKDLANKKAQEAGKKNEIIVLDTKRSNAINIGLTKLPPPRAIKAAILKMDSTIVNREGIEKLLQTMMPTEEEKTRIAEAQMANPDVPLGPAENLLLTLASIPDLEPRLRLWAFRMDYESAEKEVAEPLMDLKQALEEIESNETLRAVLAALRTIGNFLNGAEAKGFQLEYLAKVPEVKDTVHKHTLLHHLCSIVMEKFPNSTDLYSQMGAVTRASKVDFDEVARSLARMEADCKASWQHHQRVVRHGDSAVGPRMAEFLEDCAERIAVLGVIHRRVINRFRKLLVYLGVPCHSIRDTKPQATCRLISEFALEYRTTRDRLLSHASHRERTRTRGKLITDSGKFRGASEVADQQLRQLLSASEPGRTRPSQPLRSGGHKDEEEDELLETLVKTATATPNRGENRIRKKARYGDRKSLRRTRTDIDRLLD